LEKDKITKLFAGCSVVKRKKEGILQLADQRNYRE
jgi:hypothetical protein